MTPTLTEARKAILRLTEMHGNIEFNRHLHVLSTFLDAQVPLNVENDKLLERLAVAEGFVATIRDQSVMMAARLNTPVVPPEPPMARKVRLNSVFGKLGPSAAIQVQLDSLKAMITPEQPYGKAKLYAQTIAELNAEGTCTRGGWKNLAAPCKCDCLACRVRANA
jgi:hypothetical protein